MNFDLLRKRAAISNLFGKSRAEIRIACLPKGRKFKNLNFFRFKLESKDKKIAAACCLRSKLYAIKYLNDSELIKLKGR